MASLVDGFFRRLQHTFLPPHCLLCGHPGARGRDLCRACAGDLQCNVTCCPRCALPLAAPAPLCGECLQREPPFTSAFAPLVYAHPLDLLVGKLKFAGSLAAGRVLSDLWLDAIDRLAPVRPDLLVPVPLHRDRLRERGYNQALELAKPLGKAMDIRLGAALLVRTQSTPAQTNLDAGTRRKNLRGAFEFRADRLDAGVLPAHVALIDDVMTTGATLRECARVLRRAGVARVDVWALARAPKSR
jgi:ComF family protein